ncbi:head fiber protein [Bacillus mycoides]
MDGKPSTFPPSTHNHTIANITSLQTSLDAKLTASKATSQANSAATDVAGLVTDFNALLAKLKTAGVMS